MRRNISSSEIERHGNEWPIHYNLPLLGEHQYKYIDIAIVLLHEGSQQKFEEDKSMLVYELGKATIKFSDLDFFYDVLYENEDTEKFRNDYYKELTITLKAYSKYKEEVIKKFKSDVGIQMNNNLPTPVVVEILPSVGIPDVTIKGFEDEIVLKNLQTNKKIVIADGLVLEEGKNKYADYDSWGFPTLLPGRNNISVNKAGLDITLKYKPRWI